MDAELQKKLAVDEQLPPSQQREVGSVIFCSDVKGYGFIRTDSPGPDVWFHLSHVENREPLRTAQRVSFVISVDYRGRPRATDIKVEVE